ncbi:uncharacterized protein Z520_00839 [Fonsecaea multimorphosa CBS 102226]|uniref:Bulb-type lectin domain-containing protein n=1 Tax=Fonsecaea multimorphosa CBS 102226 TaxID=1442371 RepID=A0A0D2J3Z7_9EURO|nr:uncharacterized protein Z520_00839 [Fonsecaea multimorphosa CBS 102226]KIY04147.1 hypothetical protein Z520_00839 [Fonsecaea multimorphosa CBS 102226]OAL31977.1 hypothetical protein AYO22_00847 [Fonsecaea multimorphosa]
MAKLLRISLASALWTTGWASPMDQEDYYCLGQALSGKIGSFSYAIDPQASSISICTADGSSVWSSPRNHALISASSGVANLTDSSGNFEIRTNDVSSTCRVPMIHSYHQLPEGVLQIYGNFSDPRCEAFSWTLQFATDNDTGALKFHASIDPAVDDIAVAFGTPDDEAFFGLGENAGHGNLRGFKIPIWSREGGVGRGEEPITSYLNSNASISGTFAGGSPLTSYTAIASYATSRGRYLVLDGLNFAIFDLASASNGAFTDTATGNVTYQPDLSSKADFVSILYEGSSVSGQVGKEDGMLNAVTALTRLTGRQPPLPDWVNDGAILGIQGGQSKVEGIVEDALSYKMPLVGVWLQDWCGTRLQQGLYNISVKRLWWNWEPDQSLYPTWSSWVPGLLEKYQVRTLSYINTFLANVTNKPTGYTHNFFLEATLTGRFVRNATAGNGSTWIITSGPGIDAGLLDISNSTTVEWFKDLVKRQFYSVPVKGMMQDFGEYLAVDSSVALTNGDNVTAREFHNLYPGSWAQLLREVVEELAIENDTLGFHRSANTFSAPHTNLFWVGDQNIDYSREDGMRAVISSAIHMGFSGFGQTHSDIGGYTDTLALKFNITRSLALLGRWGEMGAFSGAAFRTHEGNIPSVNVQTYTNSTSYKYHTYNSRMFVALAPYRRYLAQEYQQKGWPMVRHPIVYAPDDQSARNIIDEYFFFGDALIVAPVYDEISQKVRLQLPKVNATGLTHLWTGQIYQPGQNVTVHAPYGKPAVFLRQPLSSQEGILLRELMNFAGEENGTSLTW